MTPKRYLAFGVLTIAIQTGVIASQPATSLLMSDSPMMLQSAASQDTGINRVSVNFATAAKQATPQASVDLIAQTKPQVTATSHAEAKAVLKPEAKPTPQPEVKTALKSEYKPAPKPKTKPEHKPEHMPEPVDNAANSGIKPPKELSAAATTQQTDIAEANSRSADKELTPSPVATETLITETTEEPPISQAAVSSAQTQSLKTPIVELAKPVFTSPPPQPTYPRIARKKGLEGTATIEVMFNELGEQLALKLVKSSGFSLLDQAALDAVETWQFEAPASRLASHYKVRVPIRFALN